jgi:hypothetical protein
MSSVSQQDDEWSAKIYSPEHRSSSFVTGSLVKSHTPPLEENPIQLYISKDLQAKISSSAQFSVAEMICMAAKETLAKDTGKYSMECTDVGLAVSESLVRGASTRIFADENQSIMELISNGLDASCVGGQTVGKFGFGVFSNFSWLYRDDMADSKVTVTTACEGDVNATLLELWTKLDPHEKSGKILLMKMTSTPLKNIGTTFTVQLSEKNTGKISIERIKRYVERFRFYQYMHIRFNGIRINPKSENGPYKRNAKKPYMEGHVDMSPLITSGGDSMTATQLMLMHYNHSIHKEVTVDVSPLSISVCDEGTGMTKEQLFQYFLVPSISSKTGILGNQGASTEGFVVETMILSSNTKSLFTVVVAGVAIVDLQLPGSISGVFVLKFPARTRVTIARDDMLLTPEETKITAASIMKAAEDMIGDNSVYPWEKNLQLITEAVKLYSAHSPAPHAAILRDLVDAGVRGLLSSSKKYVVSTSTIPFLKRAIDKYEVKKDEFLVYDQESSIVGERYLCDCITLSSTSSSSSSSSSSSENPRKPRLDVFNCGNILALRLPGQTDVQEIVGSAIIILPDNHQFNTADRPTLLTLLKSIISTRVILNENQTKQDSKIRDSVLPLMKKRAPRFWVESDANKYPSTQKIFEASMSLVSQVLGFDKTYGSGAMVQILGKQVENSTCASQGLVDYIDCGLLSMASAYLQWPSREGKNMEPLVDDEDEFFARAIGACSYSLTRHHTLLRPYTYDGGYKLVWATHLVPGEKVIDQSRKHGQLVLSDNDVKVSLSILKLEEVQTEAAKDLDKTNISSAITPEQIDLDTLLRRGLELKAGTDYTRRYFRHIIDLLSEGAFYMRTSNTPGVHIFTLSKFPLEFLFCRMIVLTGEKFDGNMKIARALFHLLSMTARTAAEFILMSVALCIALHPKKHGSMKVLQGKSPTFLVDLVQSCASVTRTTLTPEQIKRVLWDGNFAVWIDQSSKNSSDLGRSTSLCVFSTPGSDQDDPSYFKPSGALGTLVDNFTTIFSIGNNEGNNPFPLYKLPGMPSTDESFADFKLSSLISHLFLKPYKGLQSFLELNQRISTLPFNITSIAINEGTSKDVLNAAVTELVQNSIDAIRTSKSIHSKHSGINIKIGFHAPPDEYSDQDKLNAVEDHYASSSRKVEAATKTQQQKTKTGGSRWGSPPAPKRRRPINESAQVVVARSDNVPPSQSNFTRGGIVVEVGDAVGIPTAAFPSLMVPYLSSKDPRTGDTTGEMGNGLFNIYREAEMVVVHTHCDLKNDEPLQIIDIPIRDLETRRVIALRKIIKKLEDDYRAGSAITMYLPYENPTVYTSRLIRLQTYIKDKFSVVPSIDIRLNGSLINNYATIFHGEPIGTKCVTVQFLQDVYADSQVTTMGLPYKSLEEMMQEGTLGLKKFQTDILRRGIVINLIKPISCYQPVQSRTRLNLSPQTQVDIKSVINLACYHLLMIKAEYILKRYGTKNYQLNDFVGELTTDQDYRQILLNQARADAIYNNENFGVSEAPESALLTYYRPENGSSVAEIVQLCLDIAPRLKNIPNINENEYENTLLGLLSQRRTGAATITSHESTRNRLAVAWTLNKSNSTEVSGIPKKVPINLLISDDLRKLLEEKPKPANVVEKTRIFFPGWPAEPNTETKVYSEMMRKMIEPFLKLYFLSAKKMGFVENSFDRVQIVYDQTNGSPAWYSCKTKIISINLPAFLALEIHKLYNRLGSDGPNEIQDIVDDHESFAGRLFSHTGTLCHEMEHVRRNSEHVNNHESTHGNAEFNGKLEDYGTCMLETYKSVQLDNLPFIIKWVELFRKNNVPTYTQ